MKIYWLTKLWPKGQVVIPQEARKDLWLNPGDKVVIFSPSGKWVVIAPVEEIKRHLEWFIDLIKDDEKDK